MSSPSISARPAPDVLLGFSCALFTYLSWGLLPLYMKQVAHVPFAEVIAHRILWALPSAALLLLVMGGMPSMRLALRSPRIIGMATVTALLISCNWTVYTWAVINNRTLDTALGYYINPLVSVLMGVVLLRERIARPLVIAVVLASIAVGILTVQAGGLPWVSLVLPASFATYGYLRKTLPVEALPGFTLEALILSLPAVAYVAWLTASGSSHFGIDATDTFWLIMGGPITALPLVTFAIAARNLRLSTVGVMQFIAPTIAFLIAVFVFGEPFSLTRGIAFGFIWAGLIIYSWSGFVNARKHQTRR
ncbi:EamA family transporter RarD [Pseudochelatococcus contaminans]|uniref:Chloramphenicol-sensitive protein RarD n=1 Tax=Pseudochelatococcus contaminans TaxID=1538103 RepID=A0A7W5Z3B8_9HYPH|nr:EamA family transporter RarD [Pseudochelatococcus contaminans]MBB3809219.1 chloramphenicol-sensitive protein RarD [Pseudochelatococcus contaminans]